MCVMDNWIKMKYGHTSHNEAVELVLLCQKYASKWVFYSYFMALNGGKKFKHDLFDSLNRTVYASGPKGPSGCRNVMCHFF
jgi:hypothetical protein